MTQMKLFVYTTSLLAYKNPPGINICDQWYTLIHKAFGRINFLRPFIIFYLNTTISFE